MNRVLKRPMFRIGGSAGTGITSGLDEPKKMASASTDMDRKIKELTEAFIIYKQKGGTLSFEQFSKAFAEENFNSGGRVGYQTGTNPYATPLAPGTLPGFLTSFGLDLLSRPPQGNIFQTAAAAAKGPFETFQMANLRRAETEAEKAFKQKLAADEREFLTGERLSTQEFEKGQLEKRLDLEREKIAAGDEFSLQQLTSLYMDNYAGDPNAMIKASNHAKYVKLILPELRATVGDTQVGGVVEEDLSDAKKAKRFAKINKNNVGKIFFDVNSGTLKKLVRDSDTKQLGFIEFVVSPLILALINIFYPLHPIGQYILTNFQEWAKRRRDEIFADSNIMDKEEECRKLEERVKKFKDKFDILEELKSSDRFDEKTRKT